MKTIDKSVAQKKLVIAWLVASFFVCTLFVIVSWTRTTDNDFTDVVQWLFNYLSPGLTLMIGAFAYTANQSEPVQPKYISSYYFQITFWFSIVYLLVIVAITLLVPVALEEPSLLLVSYLKKFNIILSFLQTSVLVLLGIFFSKENKRA